MNTEEARPLANFHPSVWGDTFTSIPRDFQLWQAYSEERDVLKNEVRSMLLCGVGEWTDKLILINTIERLGVSYHFYEYIEEKLCEMHEEHANLETKETYDLFSTALYFRILRQHGYKVSSEIFKKYKGIDGKFNEAVTRDPMGMLSLYEAAHLRTHGEAILDEALAFSTSQLKSMAKTLGSGLLAKQVLRALEQPLHKGHPRIEARQFISFYEEDPSKNEMLFKFAKLDYNLVQMLYKQELSHVTRWWADIEVDSKFPQFRSRAVEGFFWAVGTSFEPCYSLARIMQTKIICVLSIADDLYDAYGTMDELVKYAKAIDGLDVDSIVDGFPDHSKICYNTYLNAFREFEEDLIKQGSYRDVSFLKKAYKENLMAFYKEAIWRNGKYVPLFKEYLSNATASSGICALGTASIHGMGHVDSFQAGEWASNRPKAVIAAETVTRIFNDIMDFEEAHSRAHVATSIDCYIKQYGVSKEEAVTKLYEVIEDTWKDINEACLRPTPVQLHFVKIFLQLMRLTHVTYKDGDGYTHPEVYLKVKIKSMFLEPIPIELPHILQNGICNDILPQSNGVESHYAIHNTAIPSVE